MTDRLSHLTASRLRSAAGNVAGIRAVVGFDGFVDVILRVVKTRMSPTRYEAYSRMAEWAERIGAAAGLSANFEFAQVMVKLGGNGPIMANALATTGMPVTYIGTLGKPSLHAVFREFARKAKVISIAEPGYTDAVEFEDGKLMFGKHQSLKEMNWANLVEAVSVEALVKMWRGSGLIAALNWTMLPNLTGVLQKLLTQVLPRIGRGRPWIFFDLADPAKRSREDLRNVLKLIGKYEKYSRVILGLNLGEARQVSEILDLGKIDETYGTVSHAASQIRDRLKVNTVVIHPVEFAAASDESGTTHVVGPYCMRPKITTGAGDHFNAGFCLGRVLGFELPECLQLGVASSGYYVRSAKSATLANLISFLRKI